MIKCKPLRQKKKENVSSLKIVVYLVKLCLELNHIGTEGLIFHKK